MKPESKHFSLRAVAILALFTAITMLAMHSGLAAPQAQAEEPAPTPTPLPTELVSLPEPTITPLPTEPVEVDLIAAVLEVTFTPDPVAPGDKVTAVWTIRDFQGSLDGVELWFTLPAAFVPLDGGSLSFDSAVNQLIIPLREAEGMQSWYVDANAQPPFDCLVEVRVNG